MTWLEPLPLVVSIQGTSKAAIKRSRPQLAAAPFLGLVLAGMGLRAWLMPGGFGGTLTGLETNCLCLGDVKKIWVFPKNMGVSPQIIHGSIGVSIINHPFWGTPNFWKHPYCIPELSEYQITTANSADFTAQLQYVATIVRSLPF